MTLNKTWTIIVPAVLVGLSCSTCLVTSAVTKPITDQDGKASYPEPANATVGLSFCGGTIAAIWLLGGIFSAKEAAKKKASLAPTAMEANASTTSPAASPPKQYIDWESLGHDAKHSFEQAKSLVASGNSASALATCRKAVIPPSRALDQLESGEAIALTRDHRANFSYLGFQMGRIFLKLEEIEADRGDSGAAFVASRNGAEFMRRFVRQSPCSSTALSLANLLARLGEHEEANMNTEAALAAFEESASAWRLYCESKRSDPSESFGLSTSLAQVARLAETRGMMDRALSAASESLEIVRKIAEIEGTKEIRQTLSLRLARVARIETRTGRPDAAVVRMREALEIARQNVKQVGDRESIRDLCVWLSEAALAESRVGNADAAVQNLRESFAHCSQVTKKSPTAENGSDVVTVLKSAFSVIDILKDPVIFSLGIEGVLCIDGDSLVQLLESCGAYREEIANMLARPWGTEFRVEPSMTIGEFRRRFQETYGAAIRVHDGFGRGSYAGDSETLAENQGTGATPTWNFSLHGNLKVGAVEDRIRQAIGCAVQIMDDGGGLANNDQTLGSLRA